MLSLHDVLQEVPLLLDLLPSESLAALLAVSQAHRRQIHGRVRHIAVPHQDHVQALVQGNWPSLISWNLGDRANPLPAEPWIRTDCSLSNVSDAALPLLVKGIRMREVMLSGGFISAAGIAQLHHANLNQLERCCLRNVGLSSAAMQAFCACTWPFLKVLDVSCNRLHAAAIRHLEAAFWPCLEELNLSCTGLSHKGLQHLSLLISSYSSSGGSNSSSRCWPALTHINVSGNNMFHFNLFLPRPELADHVTGWTCQLRWLDLTDTSLNASATQLTKVSWPRLEGMILSGNCLPASAIEPLSKASWLRLKWLDLSRSGLTASAIEQLTRAYWPYLLHLDLSHNCLTASALEQLTNAHWPHLESLVLKHTSIDADAMIQLVRRWPCLCALIITGEAVGAPALRVLLSALHCPRFTVQLTAHPQDAAVANQLLAMQPKSGSGCRGQLVMRRSHLEAALRHNVDLDVTLSCLFGVLCFIDWDIKSQGSH